MEHTKKNSNVMYIAIGIAGLLLILSGFQTVQVNDMMANMDEQSTMTIQPALVGAGNPVSAPARQAAPTMVGGC